MIMIPKTEIYDLTEIIFIRGDPQVIKKGIIILKNMINKVDSAVRLLLLEPERVEK